MNEMNNEAKTPETELKNTGAKFCPRCGRPLPESAIFCGECGLNLNGTPSVFNTSAAPQQDTAPLKTTDFLLMLLLLCVPIVGMIVYIVWAFSSDTNVNRRNFSRAYLIYYLAVIVIAVLLVLLFMIIGISTAAVLGETVFHYGLASVLF